MKVYSLVGEIINSKCQKVLPAEINLPCRSPLISAQGEFVQGEFVQGKFVWHKEKSWPIHTLHWVPTSVRALDHVSFNISHGNAAKTFFGTRQVAWVAAILMCWVNTNIVLGLSTPWIPVATHTKKDPYKVPEHNNWDPIPSVNHFDRVIKLTSFCRHYGHGLEIRKKRWLSLTSFDIKQCMHGRRGSAHTYTSVHSDFMSPSDGTRLVNCMKCCFWDGMNLGR